MKRWIFIIAFFSTLSLSAIQPFEHLEQSTPFEQILIAIQTNDHLLLRSAFDRKIRRKTADESIWEERLEEGRAYFFKRFGEYQRSDFTYEYMRKSRELIIYFKRAQVLEKKVKRERGSYKLSN